VSFHRPHLPAGLCAEASVGGASLHLSSLATQGQDSFSAAFGQIGKVYVEAVHEFARSQEIPVVHFQKGQNKEKTARPYLEAACPSTKLNLSLDSDLFRGEAVLVRNTGWFGTTAQKEITPGFQDYYSHRWCDTFPATIKRSL
jgi:hypothetical protein